MKSVDFLNNSHGFQISKCAYPFSGLGGLWAQTHQCERRLPAEASFLQKFGREDQLVETSKSKLKKWREPCSCSTPREDEIRDATDVTWGTPNRPIGAIPPVSVLAVEAAITALMRMPCMLYMIVLCYLKQNHRRMNKQNGGTGCFRTREENNQIRQYIHRVHNIE